MSPKLPAGGFYHWVGVPGGDAWASADALARSAGLIVSPGEFYCEHLDGVRPVDAYGHVRIAAVQPDERLELVERRLAAIARHEGRG